MFSVLKKKRVVIWFSVLFWSLGGLSVLAEPFELEIPVALEQAGTMPFYEVVLRDDVDSLDLYRFARECEQRAAVASGSDWSLSWASPDDVLQCRFRDVSSTLKTSIEAVSSSGTQRYAGSLSSSESDVALRFIPPAYYEMRLRLGTEGTWSGWTQDSIRQMFPGSPGSETRVHYDLELRANVTSAAVNISGYVKCKRLDSGG